MNRITSIRECYELTEASCDTVELFDLLAKLEDEHGLYNADMRIAGLYYRTADIDLEGLYNLSRYTEKSSNLEIRFLFDIMKEESIRSGADISFIHQIDYTLDELSESLKNDGIEAQFPFEFYNHLTFKRAPKNRHDSNAIEIYFRDKLAGFVPKEHAAALVKKYSDAQINNAIGIVRKKIGDARVTFDMFPLKADHWLNCTKKKQETEAMKLAKPVQVVEPSEKSPAIGSTKVDTTTFKTTIFNGESWIDITSAEGSSIPALYKGAWRQHKDGYSETFNGTEWEITKDTWWFNGKEIVKWNGESWVKISHEEELISRERLKEWQEKGKATTEYPKTTEVVTSVTVTDGSPTACATTSFVTNLLGANPAPKWISSINYRDYTGFLRTLMEYATYAHTL